MPLMKYRIYELSARAVISYSREQDRTYTFHLSAAETEKCKSLSAPHEQDDNALFYQIMCVLHGDAFTGAPSGQLVTDLSDIIFYMDFSGIFDRSGARKKHLIRQEKAKALFRPEGVSLDFGSGPHRYLAFERSGSMSRQARLSFIREDFYDAVRRRIMMDMTIGDCQLSKLYAYNGLMLSSGIRIDGIGIDWPHRVVVVDNPVRTPPPTEVITVEDDGTQNSTRKYHRVETMADVEVTCFDGEGLISKQYARLVDEKLCGKKVHTSFQIRMPYVKGMLHEVDFKDYLDRSGADTITDLWGVQHPIQKVDIILTKSMFKGCGWLTGSGMSWEDYWVVFRKYRHALYITNVSKEKPEKTTELNYQFLNTVSLKADEFRPADLPDGWDHSPETDERNWLTKQTELAYYSFCADESFRQNYFLEKFERVSWWERHRGRDQILAAVLKKNPRFINEPVYAKRLEAEADKIVEQYAVGRLIAAGDNRYLSGDLLDFLNCLPVTKTGTSKKANTFINFRWGLELNHQNFFAPGAAYQSGHVCTLLRNPHIARNEEMQLYPLEDSKSLRDQYLGHLTDVVMVGYTSLAAERLGGADYDGDMIKTISDPILNECVERNIHHDPPRLRSVFSRSHNLPLLMIPTAQPQIRNADDWEARFETVRSTFSSRVGQICNAALDRSIIAYNENSDAEERERCREETETLAILTGLEIDSAKSGIRPDLDEYLTHKTVKRSDFLKYKTLVEEMETRRAWYEPTHAVKVKSFFKKVDWSKVDSNVERLPYLAQQLKKNTPRIKARPAKDEELFSFARQSDWREQLNSDKLAAVEALLRDYDACLSRIRACRVPLKEKKRKSDVERILYARGQEDTYDPDELYALFGSLPPEKVSALRQAMQKQAWHLMDEDARERFLREWLPEFDDIYDDVFQFPPSGLDAGNSFFAEEKRNQNGRRYVGILATGSSSDATTAIRLFASLLYGAKAMRVDSEKDRDPYWTNMGYYNSIRELGQAATWIRADIDQHLDVMYKRRFEDKRYPTKEEYRKNRRYIWRDEELTSRISGSEVTASLANLGIRYPGEVDSEGKIKEHPIDICLATNMISVGLDVSRLGLMTVAGQPKTTSEYIQATSRVGRDAENAPGLVFVLYRPGRPRDKSHYEQFRSYHSRVYCNVEPTSVTPFSAPVRERALHAIMVGMMRLESDDRFNEDPPRFPDDGLIDKVRSVIENRVDDIDSEELDATLNRMEYILQCWEDWNPRKWEPAKNPDWSYADPVPLMYSAGSHPNEAWGSRGIETPTSMRSVDASCEAEVLTNRYVPKEG